jgi:plasmid replication initiation protein
MAGKVPGTEIEYRKSNVLIASKYKGTLLENKILSYALSQVKNLEGRSDSDLVYTFSAAELRHVTGSTSGSFYAKLSPVAKAMAGRMIGYENPEKNEFEYIPLIQRAEYKEGEFTIKFNTELRRYISDITSNFTRLNLQTMMNFKSDYTFRLYELLKSNCYHRKGSSGPADYFEIQYGLSELKFIIGVVDVNSNPAKSYLAQKKNPTNRDYDMAVEKVHEYEKTYEDWTGFRRRVIDPAVKEINEKTEIFVTYDTKRSGRGGKVDTVIFTMQMRETPKTTAGELTQENKDSVIDNILEWMARDGIGIRLKDALAIAEAGEYQLYEIQRAFMICQAAKDVDDPVAYIIAGLKRKFTPTREQLNVLKEKGIINIGGREEEVEFTQMSVPFEVPEEDDDTDPQ